MSRYVPARHYVSFGIVALALAGFAGWLGMSFNPAFVPAALFFLTAAMLLALAFRPAIKVYDAHLEIGKKIIPWQDVRRVDRTGWISPLVVKLSLYDDDTVMLVYPGEVDCCKHLLRTLRQMSTQCDDRRDSVPAVLGRTAWHRRCEAVECAALPRAASGRRRRSRAPLFPAENRRPHRSTQFGRRAVGIRPGEHSRFRAVRAACGHRRHRVEYSASPA